MRMGQQEQLVITLLVTATMSMRAITTGYTPVQETIMRRSKGTTICASTAVVIVQTLWHATLQTKTVRVDQLAITPIVTVTYQGHGIIKAGL